MLKVIHVPFTWFPAPVGGTEVYVRALIMELNQLGWKNAVAIPAATSSGEFCEGVLVHRLKTPANLSQEILYGAGEPTSAELFRQLLEEEKPDVVHFHAFTPVISHLWLSAAKVLGIPCVYTYHTPTLTCARGTLMRWGAIPCDGEMLPQRCAACALHSYGIARGLAEVMSWLSPVTQRLNSRIPFGIKPLTQKRSASVKNWLHGMNRIIALCEWGRQVMIQNGVPKECLSVVRHGLAVASDNIAPTKVDKDASSLVKLGFFGRLDPTKGLEVLVDALALVPHLSVEFHCHLIMDENVKVLMKKLLKKMHQDPRITLHDSVPPDAVVRTMARYDAVMVPSTWLETGPLVVLEAFAAGVPVLGSNLGGIAEWVIDGVNGLLFKPADPSAWADGMTRYVMKPELRQILKSKVVKPNGMDRVASAVAEEYDNAISSQIH